MKYKKKLGISLICMLLALVTILGSTYAWFTDSVSNTGNRIQAGTLDIDLLMAKKSSSGTYEDYTSIAESTSGQGDIFKEANYALDSNVTLWEPGKTQWVYLAIENKGSLALKYSVELNVKDEDGYPSMVQEEESALEYAIIPGLEYSDNNESLLKSKSWSDIKAYALQAANNEATNASDLSIGSFTALGSGIMDEIAKGTTNEKQYFVLAVHMKEEAGNEYKNARALIDIVINATQYTAEEDGFGNDQYDEQAQYLNDCLTFSSDDGFTLSTECKDYTEDEDSYLETSTDRYTWNKWDGSDVAAVKDGDKYYVYLRGTGLTTLCGTGLGTELALIPDCGTSNINPSTGIGMIDCAGNIMTLLDYKNPETVEMGERAFKYLFANWPSDEGSTSALRTAPELPATSLSNSCYHSLFYGCTSLKEAPELPATNLSDSCYEYMFYNCTSLKEAPELKATELAESCYDSMFNKCVSLKTAPDLKATKLAKYCYQSMFYGCSSLTSAPELKATELAESCYYYMFADCSALKTAPDLIATELANYCYCGMFADCSALETAPAISATKLARSCCADMFESCSSLTSAPELKATELKKYCYYEMFKSCENLHVTTSQPSGTKGVDYGVILTGEVNRNNNSCYHMFHGCNIKSSDEDFDSTSGKTYYWYTD